MAPDLSLNTRCSESGDQVRRARNTAPSWVRRLGSADASAGASITSYSPLASDNHAIHFPSGLQHGSRSAMPLECVRLRGLPCLAGSDHTSPRALTRARFPLGERSQLSMNFEASTARGRSFG